MDLLVGWPGGDWQATARLGTILLGAYLLILWLATVLWAYRDTQARTRDPAAQAIGIALVVVFPLIGVPLYLIVRPRETLAEAYERYLDREALFALVRGDESGERGAPGALTGPPGGARPSRGARPAEAPRRAAAGGAQGAPGAQGAEPSRNQPARNQPARSNQPPRNQPVQRQPQPGNQPPPRAQPRADQARPAQPRPGQGTAGANPAAGAPEIEPYDPGNRPRGNPSGR